MRSRDAERYDHDAAADQYDAQVADERVLIRRGYAACLRALAEDLRQGTDLKGLATTDLGAGTGTLGAAMPTDHPLVVVDLSPQMLDRARQKLAGRPVTFVHADLLAWVTESDSPLGHVVSTFALHVLHPNEKTRLLGALAQRIAPGARLCIGDLGFADATARTAFLADPGDAVSVSEAVARDHFWDWSVAEDTLRGLGFRVRRRTHGPLISSLVAVRDPLPEPTDGCTSSGSTRP